MMKRARRLKSPRGDAARAVLPRPSPSLGGRLRRAGVVPWPVLASVPPPLVAGVGEARSFPGPGADSAVTVRLCLGDPRLSPRALASASKEQCGYRWSGCTPHGGWSSHAGAVPASSRFPRGSARELESKRGRKSAVAEAEPERKERASKWEASRRPPCIRRASWSSSSISRSTCFASPGSTATSSG